MRRKVFTSKRYPKLLLIGVALLTVLTGCGSVNSGTDSGNRVIEYNGQITPADVIQVYGHRGARGLSPEQTMPAYETALRIGVDYVDMDIGITKDGVIVITHDLGLNPNLTRDASGNWVEEATLIKNMTLDEIQTYDVGRLKPGTDYAGYFPHQYGMDNVKIPTLKEAIQFVKQVAGNKVGFQIEIKTNPTLPNDTVTPAEFAKALYELMVSEDIINRTEVQAFDWRCLIELNKLNPDVKTAYLTDHTTVKLDDTEDGTWTAGLLPKDFNYSLPQMVHYSGGYCWEPLETDLTQAALGKAHNLGLKVVPWGWPEEEGTEFSYDMAETLIDWKVDGIISDRPDILRGLLSARGYDLPANYDVP